MPLLTLHLSNGATPGVTTNDTCKLHLDAEIRTQDVAVKQTRVHIQDRLVYHGAIDISQMASFSGGVPRMLILDNAGNMYKDYAANIDTGVSVVHCLLAGYRCRYTLGGDGFDPTVHKGILREGIYYGKRNINNTSGTIQFGLSHLEGQGAGENLPTDIFDNSSPPNRTAAYNHAYHRFEILDPPPFKLFNIPDTIYVEMPFSIKEEANGNVNGTSIIPVPVDNTKVTTVTNLHCVLLFEKISSGDVHLSTLDGNTPAPNEVYGTKPFLLSDSYGGVKAIDLVLEYTTNNMHSSG